ncbi:hypothetical protein K503DRAFT_777409 [Rhizopogon vinicolor AM-OR11-026]|uniref:DUF6534 domain-containing protein n=1 Tax=Rhizopogon vinicolor AM-OR11-026 TaxID=1314800 RepID=A0A1B7MGC2_9AGAM|nr:hypothetical protein K503DRAFT_777409 [Rhizopogon vinicolor AM-OR11-026]
MLIVIAHFSFGLQIVVLMFNTTFDALQQGILYPVMPFTITAFLSDLCTTIALCVLLHGNRNLIIETNVLINTLIVYAINRCLLSLYVPHSLVAVMGDCCQLHVLSSRIVSAAEITAYAISPDSLWFIAIDFVIGKLYTNSLLASLNSRNSLRGRSTHIHNESASSRLNTINISGLGPSREGSNSASTKNKKSNVSSDARVKPILDDDDDDLGLLEMGNFGRGEV